MNPLLLTVYIDITLRVKIKAYKDDKPVYSIQICQYAFIYDSKILTTIYYTSLSSLTLYVLYVLIFNFNITFIYTLNNNGLTKNL